MNASRHSSSAPVSASALLFQLQRRRETKGERPILFGAWHFRGGGGFHCAIQNGLMELCVCVAFGIRFEPSNARASRASLISCKSNKRNTQERKRLGQCKSRTLLVLLLLLPRLFWAGRWKRGNELIGPVAGLSVFPRLGVLIASDSQRCTRTIELAQNRIASRLLTVIVIVIVIVVLGIDT